MSSGASVAKRIVDSPERSVMGHVFRRADDVFALSHRLSCLGGRARGGHAGTFQIKVLELGRGEDEVDSLERAFDLGWGAWPDDRDGGERLVEDVGERD